MLALTILYEIHDITRFDRVQEFASYARLIKCPKESGGKRLGTSGAKMGNVHLKWAFSEAAVTFLRHNSAGKKILARLEKTHGKAKALSMSAAPSLHAVARDRLFDGEVPRGVAERARASQTPNSSHGTELVEIVQYACAIKRPEPSIMSQRSGSE